MIKYISKKKKCICSQMIQTFIVIFVALYKNKKKQEDHG